MTERIRIVHLVSLGYFGGVERIVNDIILNNNLPDNYIINTDDDLSEKLAKYDNVIIPGKTLCRKLPVALPVFLRRKLLWRKINNLNPDYVIIWNQVISLTGRGTGSKVIYYDHGAVWELANRKKTQWFFQQVDGCICASRASAKMLHQRFAPGGKIRVVMNGVTFSSVPVMTRRYRSGGIVAGCAARITPVKALGLIPLIVEEMRRRKLAIKFIIAGETRSGEEEQRKLQLLISRKQLSGSIELRGFTDNMPEFYQQLDVYISTSAHETCSLSCIEAMSFGVPVIAANIDGQGEIIEHGVTGFCLAASITPEEYCQRTGMSVPFGQQVYYPLTDSFDRSCMLDPCQVADSIIKICADEGNNFRTNSLVRARAHFTADRFRDRLMETIKMF